MPKRVNFRCLSSIKTASDEFSTRPDGSLAQVARHCAVGTESNSGLPFPTAECHTDARKQPAVKCSGHFHRRTPARWRFALRRDVLGAHASRRFLLR